MASIVDSKVKLTYPRSQPSDIINDKHEELYGQLSISVATILSVPLQLCDTKTEGKSFVI